MKRLFSDAVKAWYTASDDRVVGKECFPALLKEVWAGLKPEWLISGFRGSGLLPYDRSQLNDKVIANPLDGVPVSDSGPAGTPGPRGPRDKVNKLIKAVTKTLAEKVAPLANVAQATRGARKRVQAIQGELMTSELALARILEHEQTKAAKKPRGAGAKASAKSGPASEVSITFNPPPTGENANAVPLGGRLDAFVIRQARTSSEEEADVDEPMPIQQDETPGVADILVHRTLEGDLPTVGQPGVREHQPAQRGLYREVSTEESELETDEPLTGPSGASKHPKAKPIAYKDLKSGKDYIIFKYEGAHFPGLLVKKDRRTHRMTIKTMQKVEFGTIIWRWPEPECHRDIDIDAVKHVIPTPDMSNDRLHYYVPLTAQYWSV